MLALEITSTKFEIYKKNRLEGMCSILHSLSKKRFLFKIPRTLADIFPDYTFYSRKRRKWYSTNKIHTNKTVSSKQRREKCPGNCASFARDPTRNSQRTETVTVAMTLSLLQDPERDLDCRGSWAAGRASALSSCRPWGSWQTSGPSTGPADTDEVLRAPCKSHPTDFTTRIEMECCGLQQKVGKRVELS